MISELPNTMFVFGYPQFTLTFKSTLVSKYFCKLIEHLKSIKKNSFVVDPPQTNLEDVPPKNLFFSFNCNYMNRTQEYYPKQTSGLYGFSNLPLVDYYRFNFASYKKEMHFK